MRLETIFATYMNADQRFWKHHVNVSTAFKSMRFTWQGKVKMMQKMLWIDIHSCGPQDVRANRDFTVISLIVLHSVFITGLEKLKFKLDKRRESRNLSLWRFKLKKQGERTPSSLSPPPQPVIWAVKSSLRPTSNAETQTLPQPFEVHRRSTERMLPSDQVANSRTSNCKAPLNPSSNIYIKPMYYWMLATVTQMMTSGILQKAVQAQTNLKFSLNV